MERLSAVFNTFFFRPVSATGFGALRCVWGGTVLVWMLTMWQDVTTYYSNTGLISPKFFDAFFRPEYRFTLLDYITDPAGVGMLYMLLLISAFFMCIGYLPRFFTITSVVLFFSFQERNLLILGGGDTVLRVLGFLLVISPELRAFSISRGREQWEHWSRTRKWLPPLQMSIWPYRLLLWQALIIYMYSAAEKLSGDMWLDGTAVEVFFHHPSFFRWSKAVGDALTPLSTISSYFTLIWEFAWLLLLVPASLMRRIPGLHYGTVKRAILLGGIFFHLGIFVLSNVGIFPLALCAMYLGLLLDDDWQAMRRFCNQRLTGHIAVLYDGKCGLCLRSVFHLHLLDWLQRLDLINFHNTKRRRAVAPHLTMKQLDKALHIVLPDGRTLYGFRAFRALAWHLPPLWPIAPLLYVPGLRPLGDLVYRWIANRRRRCTHGQCGI